MNNLNLSYTGKNTVELLNPAPRVVMTLEAYKKICHIVDQANQEIGWLGFVEDEKGVLTIKDVYLFKQQVSATTCEITPEGIEEVVMDLLQIENGDYIVQHLHLWGHSHVNMSTSPSAQDEKQLLSFKDNGNDWFLGLIANKRGEFNFTFIDYVARLKICNLNWKIEIPGLDDKLIALEIKNEIKEKVTDLPTINYAKLNSVKSIESMDLMDDIINRYGREENNFNPYGSIAEGEIEEDELWEMAVDHFDEIYQDDKESVIRELQTKLKDRDCKYTLKQLNKLLESFNLVDYVSIGEDATHMTRDFKFTINPKEIRQGIIELAQDLEYVKPTEKFLDLAVQFVIDIKQTDDSDRDMYEELVIEFFQDVI